MARLSLFFLLLSASGCVTRIAMQQRDGADGAAPHTVVLYSGVRDGAQRYPDYTQVRADILRAGR